MDTKKYIEMPESDKWWKKYGSIPEELNDVPIVENKTTTIKNSDFIALNNAIDKLVYEFMISHEIPNGWCLNYGIDGLESLKKYGTECPMCDGYLTIFDQNKVPIISSM